MRLLLFVTARTVAVSRRQYNGRINPFQTVAPTWPIAVRIAADHSQTWFDVRTGEVIPTRVVEHPPPVLLSSPPAPPPKRRGPRGFAADDRALYPELIALGSRDPKAAKAAALQLAKAGRIKGYTSNPEHLAKRLAARFVREMFSILT
jgi:hypothetical protein